MDLSDLKISFTLIYTWQQKWSFLGSVFLHKTQMGIFFETLQWEILASSFLLT